MNQDKRNRRYVEKFRKKHYKCEYEKMTDEEWEVHKQYNAPLPVGLIPNAKRFIKKMKNHSAVSKALIYILGFVSGLLVNLVSHLLGWS